MGEATWYEAFPWLARALRRAASVEGQLDSALVRNELWADAINIGDPKIHHVFSRIAGLASSQLPGWELVDLFPHIPFETENTSGELNEPRTVTSLPAEWIRWGSLSIESLSEIVSEQHLFLTQTLEALAELNVLHALRDLKVKDARRTVRSANVRITKPGAGLKVRLPLEITLDGKRSGTTFASWRQSINGEVKKRRAWNFGSALVVDGRGLDRDAVNAIATIWQPGAPFVEAVELPDGTLFVFRDPSEVGTVAEPIVRIPIAFADADANEEESENNEDDAENEITDESALDEYRPYAPQATAASQRQVSSEPASESDLADTIDAFIELLTPRDLSILRGRVLSKPKLTLAQLGDELQVTRERVRQIESNLLADLSEWFTSNDTLCAYSHRVREVVGELDDLQSLLNALPELEETLESVNMPTWFVFDQFDDSFESDGVWVATPSLRELQLKFERQFESYAGTRDFIELDEFVSAFSEWQVASPDVLLRWAQSLGFTVVVNCLATPRIRSMNDLAYVALSAHRKPMSLDALHAAAAPERSKRSLANQLSTDERMTRVGADLWALTEWGGEAYVSIQDEIFKRVDEHGAASLRELLEELPERFGVAVASIRTYANSWPLETVGDVVRRATKAAPRSRPLERTRGVYFDDGGFSWRFVTTFDHVRGSGSAFPTALAGALGNSYGQTMNVPIVNSTKSLTLRWNGNQATMGTIRELLTEIGAHEHEHVAFSFSKGELTARRLGLLPDSYEERLRFLLCIPAETPVDRRSVASKLGLPADSLWHEIIEAVEARREQDVLEAIAEMNAHYTE